MFTLKDVSTEIFMGDYNPEDYNASNIIDNPRDIIEGINDSVNPDSLLSYLTQLQQFENRNTGSDTISDTFGIGAARRWIYKKLEQFSLANEGRLVVDFFQFDRAVCNMNTHRNVIATLPGRLPSEGIILIEAHMDSRCESVCDVDCLAQGMEDNASGVALVLELANAMSPYTFDRTIVFMLTTGEEQGLVGADAMAKYMRRNDVDIKAVLNNDVIGGIACGETSSPPSCPGEDHIDSTQVRVFSASMGKPLARYAQLQYQEELEPIVDVPMKITLMSAEDRSGRGGDHIPFREQGYTSIRFTSANEHGDAGIDADYRDRQHTSGDILGIDTSNDGKVDSFYVDFNYLARNTVINGVTATMISASPSAPTISAEQIGYDIKVTIEDPEDYLNYRIALRTSGNLIDSFYQVTGTKEYNIPITGDEVFIFVSALSVNEDDIESCFSNEERIVVTATSSPNIEHKNVVLLQNRPNPFDEATIITWHVSEVFDYEDAYLVIRSLDGKEILRDQIDLNVGINEFLYTHGYQQKGMYTYAIEINNELVDVKTMVFAY
jgi:hypothetical protein